MRHALCTLKNATNAMNAINSIKRYIDGNNSIYETKSRVFTTEAEVEA